MSKEIKKQAKKIIDKFVEELDKVDTEEARVEREEDRREEKEGEEDGDFREIFLNNAPKNKKGYLKGEKGKWER
jgi:Asp-tRNA(Asn)/Glu-tRNA(Gln) amidotransferase C subunit